MITARVHFQLLKIGACHHPEWVAMRGGGWRHVPFPALCGLIQHPTRGWMLYDTGYADHFLEATARMPERLYRTLLPVQLSPEEQLLVQLRRFNIDVKDIGTVLISHYHGDHIAGLRDFPHAKFLAMRHDTEEVLAFSRWHGLLRGFLPALLPTDFQSRLEFVEESRCVSLPIWMAPFQFGYDIFNDRTMFAVPLPGHSHCQMGLLLRDQHDAIRLLVADACWSLQACRAGRLPSPLAGFAFSDRHRYRKTFFGLREIALREPDLCLIPSHCFPTWKKIAGVGGA